ncbi:hypothetical protein ACTQW9_18985, partial [Lachnospiraceae bacterium LCP19S3_B12]
VIRMVSDSNCWLIAADWRQYFFIKYRNLPPETIGVPLLARAIVPSGTARKAAGDPPLLFVRVSTPTSPQNHNFVVGFWLDF